MGLSGQATLRAGVHTHVQNDIVSLKTVQLHVHPYCWIICAVLWKTQNCRVANRTRSSGLLPRWRGRRRRSVNTDQHYELRVLVKRTPEVVINQSLLPTMAVSLIYAFVGLDEDGEIRSLEITSDQSQAAAIEDRIFERHKAALEQRGFSKSSMTLYAVRRLWPNFAFALTDMA